MNNIQLFLTSTLLFLTSISSAQDNSLSFFVTSIGSGNGADLGGLTGADAHCQMLATTAGAGNKNWRAYLSTVSTNNQAAVNARDRIGQGPWYNAKGVRIAQNLNDLHSTNNKLSKTNSIDEKGNIINGFGDKPNRHDILTGSTKNGMASNEAGDTTCSNWQNSGKGSALVGHHDRMGGNNRISWNSAHGSFGCSQEKLKITGGNGYFYCFSAD